MEKVDMGILESSTAPYSKQCFRVPEKNNTLHFIEDLQPINKEMIQNAGIGPTIVELVKAFIRRSIYSVGDLYSRYDHNVIYIDAIEEV